METGLKENPNVAARLTELAAGHPERDAIVEYRRGRSRRVTFRELAEQVASLAAELRADGIAPGDRVLLFVPMSINLYVAVIACLSVGAAAVFVDAWADRRRLDAAIAVARPKAFLGSPRAHLLRLVSASIRRIPIRKIVGEGWLPRTSGRRPRESAAAWVQPDAPALITFTTGSTGQPKAAARSHAFLWAQHRALVAYMRPTEADIDMPTLPIFVLNNLAMGVPSLLPDFDPRRPAELDPAAIYQQLQAEGVTTSSGSPAFYEKLAGWCARSGRTLPLRALFTGGAVVPPPLARLLQGTVAGTAHVVYGSTEAEPIAAIPVPMMLAAMEAREGITPEGVCVGRPVSGIDVRVAHPFDGPIVLGPDGWQGWEVSSEAGVGELVVAGEHVLGGYLENTDADRENKIADGHRIWHRTGDAVRRNADGCLWLMGRVKERVQRADRVWWSIPAEVHALETRMVTHAAYIGVPDPVLGQRAVLCVEPCTGRLSNEDRRRLIATLAPIPVDEIHVLRHLPRDPRHASKTDVEALRRLLFRPSLWNRR